MDIDAVTAAAKFAPFALAIAVMPFIALSADLTATRQCTVKRMPPRP